MSNELLVVLTGALPISEVRGAIPLAIGVFGFSPFKAYFLGLIGNLTPVIPILLILNYLSDFLMRRFYFFNRFFNWLFQYTRERHAAHFEKHHHRHLRTFWLSLALFVFVAVPLPFTGIWSGVIAAFVFGIPFIYSLMAISFGAATAGLIVLLISLGIIGIF